MAPILLDNRFSILHLESTSNFSKVFFALDTYQNPPRNCAIKVYQPITQKIHIKHWITQEFQKEANRLKQLSLAEPHLPEIYTYLSDAQGYYLVRELIEGITLRERVQTQGVLSSEMVRKILAELLLTLEFLHQEKVIHQNIRPKNIILRSGDNTPISINFGSIKQIVATFDFHGNRNIFSLNDVRGYTPSEQALGKPIPASDIYSLGLTAVYLLTAKDPGDLALEIDSGNYKVPEEITDQDSDLAVIINRAINLNPGDRYQSAREMLDALFAKKPNQFFNRSTTILNSNIDFPNKQTISIRADTVEKKQKKGKNKTNNLWIFFLFLLLGCISLANLYLFFKYKDRADTNNNGLQIPESPILLPKISNKVPQKPKPLKNQTSILNDRLKNVLEIPIFTTGSPKNQLRNILGEPNAIQKGYWANSSAWIYKKQANGSIDLGYLFDNNTDKLRQTEIAIASSVNLLTIQEILDSLLQGNLNPTITQGLQNVYQRQTNVYSFKVGNLEGSIEREKDDNIYIGIWDKNFH